MKQLTARVGLGTVIAVLALTLAAPAYACNDPKLQVSPKTARPGDVVRYTIIDLTAGAQYSLSIKGHPVASGAASGTSAAGSFTMPDLGSSSGNVSVSGSVQHSDIESSGYAPLSDSINYIAPAAPAASHPPTAPPSKSPAAPSHSVGTTPGSHAGTPGAGGHPTGPGGRGGSGGVHVGPGSPGAPNPAGGGQTPRPGSAADISQPASAGAAVATLAHEAASAKAAAAPARKHAAPAVRLPRPASVAEPPTDGSAIPAIVLVALSLLLLTGVGGVGVRFVRARGVSRGPEFGAAAIAWIPPDVAAEARARDVLIDAELQEMIAEARASELSVDRDVTPVGPADAAG